MNTIYLFDWGDTLMVDFTEQPGKMCDWPEVRAVDGALATLAQLSRQHAIYIATNAADSAEADIHAAFSRVGLAPFIRGYFCKANLGIGKGSPEFFERLAAALAVPTGQLLMVGDNYHHDIAPALAAGAQAIWFNPTGVDNVQAQQVRQISELTALIDAVKENEHER